MRTRFPSLLLVENRIETGNESARFVIDRRREIINSQVFLPDTKKDSGPIMRLQIGFTIEMSST